MKKFRIYMLIVEVIMYVANLVRELLKEKEQEPKKD